MTILPKEKGLKTKKERKQKGKKQRLHLLKSLVFISFS